MFPPDVPFDSLIAPWSRPSQRWTPGDFPTERRLTGRRRRGSASIVVRRDRDGIQHTPEELP